MLLPHGYQKIAFAMIVLSPFYCEEKTHNFYVLFNNWYFVEEVVKGCRD